VTGLFPFAESRMPYGASKTANISLTENLAIFLEPRGIRVSCLIPGPVRTDTGDAKTSWSPDAPMRGPGSEFDLKLVNEVPHTLADGMRDGKILIPTHEVTWDVIKRWAGSPDAFLRTKSSNWLPETTGACL
jgi:NAD(P)-dependent dehydrogenase (short-subunit alcohol dehydrogenase family)